jgi:hypothetical protein
VTGPEDDARRDSGASSDDASGADDPTEQARAREDAAWEAIVAHYGDRPDPAVLDDPVPGAHDADTDAGTAPAADAPAATAPVAPVAPDPDDRFVPPTPPPVAWPTRWRAVAWGGVFGAPAVLLLVVVAGIDLPDVIDYLLVAWFIGGFLGLVSTMRQGPRDPWDDGSRV